MYVCMYIYINFILLQYTTCISVNKKIAHYCLA